MREGLDYPKPWQWDIKLGVCHVYVCVHGIWCPGEDHCKVSGSVYTSHGVVHAVQTEAGELKWLSKQKEFISFFI